MATPSTLIIDYDRAVRESIQRLLLSDNVTCSLADNGIDGLKQFMRTMPRVVFLDMHLPQMDGLAVLRRIYEIRPHSSVVMMSAAAKESEIAEALNLGATYFLRKPMDIDTFENVFRQMMYRNLPQPAGRSEVVIIEVEFTKIVAK